jgi:hypothetical protein
MGGHAAAAVRSRFDLAAMVEGFEAEFDRLVTVAAV